MLPDKLVRYSLAELEDIASKLDQRGHRAEAEELLVYQHLFSAIRANNERDLLVSRLALRFDALEAATKNDRVIVGSAYRALLAEFKALREQQERDAAAREADRARLDILQASVDANIEKILEVARRAEALVAEDLDAPTLPE